MWGFVFLIFSAIFEKKRTSMPKRILFIIDEIELKHFEFNDLVTDFWLIKEFLLRDYAVSVTTKNRLFIEENKGSSLAFESYLKDNDIFYKKEEKKEFINNFDVVFFRPDPPVDIDYINACYVFDFVDKTKTLIINDPQSVVNFNEKTHINYFPDYVPQNMVTSSKKLIKEFVEEHKEAIIKPLNRCFGNGVYYLNHKDKNLNSIISASTNGEKTSVMVQKYLDKAQYGDKRVLIIGEKVYSQCITKLPGENDFKFNTHNDKFFAPAELTEKERKIATDIAKIMNQKGLYMIGLDVIDEKVIEINVTSPCYFIREINKQYNIHFEEEIMEDLILLIGKLHPSKPDKLYSSK